MTLVLSITNADHLDNGEPTQMRLDKHGAIIGRSPHSDWSLPDPKSYISSTHCEIDYRDGGYLLVDKSTNGTFVNGSSQRLAEPYSLKDGDVITIGHYRVAVSGTGAAASTAAAAGGSGTAAAAASAGEGWGGWGAGSAVAPSTAPSNWDAPPAADAWGAAPSPPPPPPPPPHAPPAGWAAPAAGAAASSGWSESPTAVGGGWPAAASEARSSDPWSSQAAPSAPAAGRSAPASAAPPSSWDAPAASTGGGWPSGGGSEPGAGSLWGPAGAGPAKPAASGWDALAPAPDAARSGADALGAGVAAPVTGRGALSGAWAPPRAEAPPSRPAADVADVWGAMAASNTVDWTRGGFGAAEPVDAAASLGPGGDAAWAALLKAAGVPAEGVKASHAEVAGVAGALLKRMIAGLVVMMEARARAKAQLGAQSTTLELNGNNPLKFARSPERVLQQLLNPAERGFMGATDAVEDSFRDLQAHQMATLAAMQGALRATLERFSPEAIRKRAEMRGVLARILPAARNATLWEAYEREFEGVAKGSDEAFMDVFAKAFKEAYERTAAEMKAQAGSGLGG